MTKTFKRISLFFSAFLLSGTILSDEVEVLHWWTSSGEKAAVDILEEAVKASGLHWVDFAVEGSAGRNAMTVLKSRVISGNPPTAAQIRGKGIEEWASLGLLSSIDDVAQKENWDEKLPELVSQTMKFQGGYVAAPVNIHRNNWLWVNKSVFDKTGLPLPRTWADVFRIAPALQKAGYIPLAFGGEPWQASTLFENVLLSVNGADFYRKVMVDNDPAALNSQKMKEVFNTLSEIKTLFDEDSYKRQWYESTRLVIEGRAAMQVMGDWAKGEFLLQGKQPGQDFLCIPAPGTEGGFVYNIDSFVMFNMPDSDMQKAQQSLASLLMKPEFQVAFNKKKGAIPALQTNAAEEPDICARKSREDYFRSKNTNTLVPSITHGMAAEERIQAVVTDVVSDFIRGTISSADEAARRLAAGIQAVVNQSSSKR